MTDQLNYTKIRHNHRYKYPEYSQDKIQNCKKNYNDCKQMIIEIIRLKRASKINKKKSITN